MRVNSWLFRALEVYGTRVHHPGQWRAHAKLRRLLRVNVDQELTVTRAGCRWQLNPADYTQREFFWLGEKDSWDVFHLMRLVRPGAVILDIGANFGFYALTFARALARCTRIIAFEPFPATFRRLSANIALNGLQDVIEAHPVALSDREGRARMWSRPDNSGASAVLDEGTIEVPVTTLDGFSRGAGLDRLDLIKIDVEGHEESVLRGASDVIARHHPVLLVEIDPPKLDRARTSPERVLRLLADLGYGLWVARRRRLEPLDRVPRGDTYVNVFGLHPSGT
jgi:FkbM family methyltransferase